MHVRNKLGALVGAVAAALAVSVGVGLAVTTAAPSNTSLPSVSGAARDGSTLSASHGGWSGSPTDYAYQWQRCDSQGGNCAAITGANSNRYTLTTAEVGHDVRVVVTATNKDGTGTATSRPTNSVQATGSAPANTAPPTISGTPKENETLSINRGSWNGNPSPTFTYQWQRCDATGGACADIAGATGTTYKATTGDVGSTLRVKVNATNSRGSTLATAAETSLIAPATSGGGGGGKAISVTSVSLPNRLTVDGVKFAPTVVTSRAPVVARFHVSDTRGFSIQGALVYALGLPYGWVGNAPEAVTDSSGWATVTMGPTSAMPLRNAALVVFVRARKPGDDLLAGVSTRRLVQVSIR